MPNVTSDFAYSQDINTAGVQLTIILAQSADTSSLANSPLTTENSGPLTDENNNALYTDGVPPIVGNSTDTTLIRNNNDLLVYEFSEYYPNGKLRFTGYIDAWQANFGGNDDDQITITAYSNGTDMANFLILGGLTPDQEQLSSPDIYDYGFVGASYGGHGNSFVIGEGVPNLSAISVVMGNRGTVSVPITLFLYSGAGISGTPILSQTLNLPVGSPQTLQFIFSAPVGVIASQTYTFIIGANVTSNIFLYVDFSFPYTEGKFFNTAGLAGGVWTSSVALNISAYFETFYTSNATYVPFIGQDPSTILTNIIEPYIATGGSQSIPSGGYPLTGVPVTYSFNVNTVLEGIQAIQQLSPPNWYWYSDIAQEVLYFKQASIAPAYTFIKGVHLTSIQLGSTIEQLKNIVYFTGGDTGGGNNLFVSYADQISINANNGQVGLDRISDSNVTDAITGIVLAKNDTNGFNYELYQTMVTILDSTMDITLPQVGDSVGFSGFGTFVDSLVLQIVRIQYTPEQLTLTLGKLPPRMNPDFQRLRSKILALENLANPTSPT